MPIPSISTHLNTKLWTIKFFEKIYVPSFKGEFPAEKFIKVCQCSQNGIPKLCEYGSENHIDVAGK